MDLIILILDPGQGLDSTCQVPLITDADPTCQVITDPDPDPTCKVITEPDPTF